MSIDPHPESASAGPTVAIVGAGFCGLMTAWHLLRQARPLRVVLLDNRGLSGRGAAYQALSPAYVLNVPARNMGALPEDPAHFWRWLEAREPGRYAPADFVPRQLYGSYLETLLAEARAAQGPALLEERSARAIAFEQGRLRLDDGSAIEADRIVLATGNQAPAHPRLREPGPAALDTLPGYYRNPWQAACLQGLDPQRPVLLLGSGLTMVDLALGLRQTGFEGQILAVSPHGYVPLPHRPTQLWPDFLADRPWPAGLSAWLQLVRQQAAAAAAAGIDWRAVIDALRPHSARIWQGLSLDERQRFMRHLRHRWGVLRHRLPAEIDARLQAWIAEGSLSIRAGRLESLAPHEAGLLAEWRPRGSAAMAQLQVQRVINCTGPDGNYLALDDPLYASLRDQGLLQADPLGLGLAADASGALLDASGSPSARLYSLGPPLRGLYWESTAVPELRRQAVDLATTLVASLSAPAPSLSHAE